MQKLKLIQDMKHLEKYLKEGIKGVYSKGDNVAVKVHMGEKGNKFYLKPELIRRIVDVLKAMGLKPFLFDSVVLYSGARDTKEKYCKTAEEHGFTEKTMGCPIIISDTGVDVKEKDITIHVCKELSEADGLLTVSHVKGHCCYGFGGAIKNLGMGGVTPKSKREIHLAGWSVSTDELLAQGAKAVLSFFKKQYYVNFIIDIAKECDCCGNAGPIVAPDIGILFGKDIVAVDTASLDLINKIKKDVFKKLHNKDPYLHVKFAEKLGMGDGKYELC